MGIKFHTENIDLPELNYKKVIKCINNRIRSQTLKIKEINYIFCNEDYILNVNKQFLNHDYYTDVITFRYDDKDAMSSDIFISPETVKSNAELYKQSLESEYLRVIFHGFLHLIGHNDSDEKQKYDMRQLENEMILSYQNLV